MIGGGVSGLVSAYLLSKAHEVVLYERNDYFGGHSHTVTHNTPRGPVHLDTGFIVYNQPAYPRFAGLLSELAVSTQPSDMSFSVSCGACNLAYSSRSFAGMMARPAGMLKPRNLRFGLDLLRFYRQAPREMDDGSLAGQTLREYLELRKYSDQFRRHFIVPLAAAVWSMPPQEVDGFPAPYMLRFLYNHGLIGGDSARWQWRTVTGGSRAYVGAILERLGSSARTSAVTGVTRTGSAVSVHTAAGREEYDAAIMACHADEARSILLDADDEERGALGKFVYTQNRVVLHTDESLLPPQPAARASWNYVTADCRGDGALGLTYHLNRLQALDCPTQYCVTVNATAAIRPGAVLKEMTYSHPRYGFETLEGQRQIASLQGERRLYFAGAHLGYGFHEDGVESAYRVAAMLGVQA